VFRERLEPLFAVVLPHAARADAAKRQFLLSDVEDRVVDGDVAGEGLIHHTPDARGIVVEVVQGERPRTIRDVVERFVERAARFERQQRTEDLISSGNDVSP